MPKFRVPVTWPAAKAVRVRRSTTHSPAAMRAASGVLVGGSGADRSGAPGPAVLPGAMWA